MRTIKFRAKNKEGHWIHGDLFMTGTDPTDKEWAIQYWSNEDGWMHENINPETIGQFTGLLDHYGNEIYEGDILKFYSDEEGYIEVRFVRGIFAFLWKGNLDDELPINAPTQEWAQVIGNIHDNPEMLKGGAK